jgi:hypothetical protein
MGQFDKQKKNWKCRGCLCTAASLKKKKNSGRRTDTQQTMAECFRTKVPKKKRMMVSTYEKAVKGVKRLPEKVHKRKNNDGVHLLEGCKGIKGIT